MSGCRHPASGNVRRVQLVSGRAVSAAVGAAARIYRTPLSTYVLGTDVLVIVFEPGDRPDGTGVRDNWHVAIAPPFPDEIHTLLYEDSLFHARRPGGRAALRFEGYARLSGGVPLGPLRSSAGAYDHCSKRLLSLTFELDAALPFGLLERIRSAAVARPAQDVPSVDWLHLLPHDPVGALSELRPLGITCFTVTSSGSPLAWIAVAGQAGAELACSAPAPPGRG